MRSVGIRKFNKEMYTEIGDLPVMVGKWGSPQFVVLPWEMWDRAKNPGGHRPIGENKGKEKGLGERKLDVEVSQNTGVRQTTDSPIVL